MDKLIDVIAGGTVLAAIIGGVILLIQQRRIAKLKLEIQKGEQGIGRLGVAMNDSSEATPSRSLSDLAGSIQELDSLLRGVRVTSAGILCQVATLDLALQVLEAAKATLLLRLTAVPRTTWTTARLAFESMHDLFYLLELCPDRQAAGAKIYVGAMAARKQAEGRLRGYPRRSIGALEAKHRAYATSSVLRRRRSRRSIRGPSRRSCKHWRSDSMAGSITGQDYPDAR